MNHDTNRVSVSVDFHRQVCLTLMSDKLGHALHFRPERASCVQLVLFSGRHFLCRNGTSTDHPKRTSHFSQLSNVSSIHLDVNCDVGGRTKAANLAAVTEENAIEMLVPVRHKGLSKWVRVPKADDVYSYHEFIQEVLEKFNLPESTTLTLKDASGVEVDPDIFDELLKSTQISFQAVTEECHGNCVEDSYSEASLSDASFSEWSPSRASASPSPSPSSGSDSTTILETTKARKKQLTEGPPDSTTARDTVKTALLSKPGGDAIFKEYDQRKCLSDSTRRKMVNTLVADMVETHGRVPPVNARILYALGIITMFPNLRDPESKNGYEHFYDYQSGSGYLAWRLKTVQRNSKENLKRLKTTFLEGPKSPRQIRSSVQQLSGDECKEAMSMMRHSADSKVVKEKMMVTFQHRQKMLQDPAAASSVLDHFPRFLDTPGLIDQDFIMLFGEEVSAWDSEMAALLLLLHLLPPTCKGRKTSKISTSDAVNLLVKFVKVGQSMETFLQNTGPIQPFLLPVYDMLHWKLEEKTFLKRDYLDWFFVRTHSDLVPWSCRHLVVPSPWCLVPRSISSTNSAATIPLGIDKAYTDSDITEFFKANGDIKKIVRVPDDPQSPLGRTLIEYSSDRTISRLDPAQLGDIPSPNDPAVTWSVRTIRELCQEELGREMAQKCLAELSSLAGISKAGFWDVLQGELQSAQSDLAPPQSPDTQLQPVEQAVSAVTDNGSDNGEQTNNVAASTPHTIPRSNPNTAVPSLPVLDQNTVNPPHVQKVIVEHFIRSDSTPSSYSQSRIRTFSGRLPKPNGEVDYDAWRTQVDLLLNDMSLSDSQKVRRILESLLSPAADIVKPLGTNATPQAYLTQLESAFGVVEDGEELFATFLGSNQNSGIWPDFKLLEAPAMGRSGAEVKEQISPTLMLHNERSLENDSHSCKLPPGLVGPRCTSTILIGNVKCESILDTGSQVTTISEAFHSKYLSNLPVQSIHNLLEVEGAGGQAVPYLGYVEVRLTFPEDVTGTEEQMPVLALIVPEYEFNVKVPVLIGTNVLLQLYQRGINHDKSKFLKRSDSFAVLLQHVARVHKTETKACPVKLHGEKPITIPARHKICLFGDVRVGKANPNTNFVIEPPEFSSLPGGLFLQCALININTRALNKIPVVLSNTTDHSVTLPPKCIIGEVSAVQSVTPLTSTAQASSQASNGKYSFNLDNSPMPEEWKERIQEKLNSIPEVFALDELSFGHTTAVKHHIRLQDDTPFKERSRPIHPSDREAVRQHLRELLDAGIIRESESPFASPVVVVKKKNGKIRLCIDYRKLNSRTIKDAYALPNIEETFSALSGARWFSVMDLKSGYYQVEMTEEDKAKTAFTCPLGFYEFNRMPQGVTNAPSTFQRLMEKCTLEEHETRLMKVLNRMKNYGLKLSPEKCQFFQPSVKYLGHVVDAQGVHTDPNKVSALKDWPRPVNREELKRFLGFAGYYRRFVEGYSKIARPLNTLTAGYYPPRKRGKVYKAPRPIPGISPRTPFGAEWSSECESSFRTLIEKLTSAPVLAFANPKLPYVLHTDACCEGLGAALYQEQDGKLRVVAYASRGLSKSEKNYPTHKLEFLALKWAVCEKFCDYLYGADFTVLTDNNPLTYVLSSAKLDAAGHRWLAALSTFRFNIKYRAGRANGDADGLSRRPQSAPHEDRDYLEEKERIRTMTKRLLEGEIPSEAVSAVCQRHSNDGQNTLPGMTNQNWYEAQRNDPSIGKVIGFVERGQKPHFKDVTAEPLEVKLLLREWDRLELIDDVLYRKCFDRGSKIHQLILPAKYRERVLTGFHDDVGHLGPERVFHLARARCYWPKMKESMKRNVTHANAVSEEKLSRREQHPWNILVITDHFTRFAVAVPTKDQKARTVAKALWDNFLVYYGFPSRLHSDQGRDFESRTIKELCSLIGAEKVRTTPYHPQGNPVERFNRTLISMLGTLEEKDKHHWRDFVKPVVHAYNCTRNDSTGYSPYELMFGRQPTLPVDLILGLKPPTETHTTHSDYVQSLRQRLKESYALAAENSRKSGERNKLRFDAKVKSAELAEGDRVLVKNVNIRGKHKLADKWERMIHVVVKRIDGGPVYVVKPESGKGPHRTLHRDLLLPCGFLPVETTPESKSHQNKQQKMHLRSQQVENQDTECDNSDGEEDDGYYVTEPLQVMTWGPYVQEFVNAPACDPQSAPDPMAPEVRSLPEPQTSRDNSVIPLESPEAIRAVNQSPLQEDYVVIDIPDTDITQSPVVTDSTPVQDADDAQSSCLEPSHRKSVANTEDEQSELRRSLRDRHPPPKFTYDELGKPLILALSQFFGRLQEIIPDHQMPCRV
ncbi:hypothetical protein WMY93_022306 [Mugilogobius chulae]|uniref:Gypsy retrotransposon integrase-like protein 1 n=1 Tax=Mugilogobius chulae TaxID=88201 RepID=A0AAW0NCE3_9GOBI